MAKKGHGILLTVLIVLLLYVISIIIVTRPGFEESTREKIAQKTGVPLVSESTMRAMVQAEVSRQLADVKPEVPSAEIQSEVARQVSQLEIPEATVQTEVDVDKIASQASVLVLQDLQTDYVPLIADYVLDYQADHPELTIQDIEPYVPTITKQVSEAVYAKIPDIAEQLLPALQTYVPQLTADVYPQVLAKTLETFSDSQQLQKAMLEWLASNEDQLVKDIISQVVVSNELSNAVGNIIVAEADTLSPEIIKSIANNDSLFMSKAVQRALENNPDLLKQIAMLVAKELPTAHVVVASGPVVGAAVSTPASPTIAAKTAESVPAAEAAAPAAEPAQTSEAVQTAEPALTVEAAQAVEPVAAAEPAAEPAAASESAPVVETPVADVAEVIESSALKTSAPTGSLVNSDAFYSQNTDVVHMTDSEYLSQESEMRQSLVDSFKSRLKK